MKKLLVTAGIALFAITGAMAQASFGLKAGLNVSNLRGNNAQNTKGLFGGNAGLFAKVKMSDKIYLQPEVLYSLEGTKYDNSDVKTKLNYVNVPLMVKYQTVSGFYVEAGPQVGFLVSAKNELGNVTTDIKNNLKSTDFSVGAGLGFNLDKSVGVGARFNLGLSNISEVDNNEVNTSNFALGLHYNFGN